MNVVFIKRMQGCKKFTPYCLQITVMCLLAMAFFTFRVVADVPVIESQPTKEGFNRDEVLIAPVILEARAVIKEPKKVRSTDEFSINEDAAYLLTAIDQLNSEVMALRGQAEEQAHIINQLQQESRDRYLDLDERINNIAGSSASVVRPVVDAFKEPDQLSVISEGVSSEKAAYDRVFKLIREKKFTNAEKALKKQLADYPVGEYAGNSLYWLGEVEMALGKHSEAKNSFLSILRNYSNSVKVPDATYKLGRLSDLLGDKKMAITYLKSVIKNHPESAASKLADTYLQSLMK